MNEKNEHLAVEVENNPFFQAVMRMIDREKQPLVEQLEEANRRASEMRDRAASAEERAESAEERAASAEERQNEARKELEALRARIARTASDDE